MARGPKGRERGWSSLKLNEICHHQMRFMGSSTSKIRLRPGLRPGPRWGSLQRAPRPASWWGGELAAPSQELHPRSRPFGPRASALQASSLAPPNPKTKLHPWEVGNLPDQSKYGCYGPVAYNTNHRQGATKLLLKLLKKHLTMVTFENGRNYSIQFESSINGPLRDMIQSGKNTIHAALLYYFLLTKFCNVDTYVSGFQLANVEVAAVSVLWICYSLLMCSYFCIRTFLAVIISYSSLYSVTISCLCCDPWVGNTEAADDNTAFGGDTSPCCNVYSDSACYRQQQWQPKAG